MFKPITFSPASLKPLARFTSNLVGIPWVGIDCSNGHTLVNFGFDEFLGSFFGKIFKKNLRNRMANCFKIALEHFWVPLDLNLLNRWHYDFFGGLFSTSSPERKHRFLQKLLQFSLYA